MSYMQSFICVYSTVCSAESRVFSRVSLCGGAPACLIFHSATEPDIAKDALVSYCEVPLNCSW